MKQTNFRPPPAFFGIMIVAGLAVIITAMMHSREILIPLMMAILVAIVCNIPKTWLQQKGGLPEWLALLLVITGLVSICLLVAWSAGASAAHFLHNIPKYQDTLQQQMDQLSSFLASRGLHMKGHGIGDIVKPGSAMRFAGILLSDLRALLANGFIILILVVLMLSEKTGISDKLKCIHGEDAPILLELQIFGEKVKEYMSIKTLLSLATGALATVALAVIGVNYPLLWGTLAFALNFIPSIGSIMAAIPPILLALIQLGPGRSIAVAACYLVINVVIGNLIEPRLMGKGLGLSTLVVFLSLLFWGWVLGPTGMLLSVVLTLKLKLLLDSHESTQWLGLLLGPNPKNTPDAKAS